MKRIILYYDGDMMSFRTIHDVFPKLELNDLMNLTWSQSHPIESPTGGTINAMVDGVFNVNGQIESLVMSDSIDVLLLLHIIDLCIMEVIGPYSVVTGRSYDFRLISVRSEVGEIQPRRPWPQPDPFDTIRFNAIRSVTSNNLNRAYYHLRRAILSDGDTELHCFMALETIRQYFVQPNDKKTASSWDRMRAALHIDRAWIDKFTEIATKFRHGDFAYGFQVYDTRDRVNVLKGTREVIEKFALYLRNQQQIP